MRGLPVPTDPNVLIGSATSDDAAVYRIDDDLALVVTADFFTPVVDDPYDFGRIAAANALSDLYAMGARPAMALNLVGFPSRDLPIEVLGEILRGGAVVAGEASCPILGGHTIDDAEPKYGLVCIGFVQPGRITANIGALPGDRLVLTKPLGVGIIATAIKRDCATTDQIAGAVASMTTLNAAAAAAVRAANSRTSRPVHAVTDVTGFGLLGHLREMVEGSGFGATICASAVPLLQGATLLAADGVIPGGTRRNADWLADAVQWDPNVDGSLRWVLYDAQTSGGLLISVAEDACDDLLADLNERGTPAAAVVGEVISRGTRGSLNVVA